MNQTIQDEIKKTALESGNKIFQDFKAFSFLCNGYSAMELAIMIGAIFEINTEHPKEAYERFSFVLKEFMESGFRKAQEEE